MGQGFSILGSVHQELADAVGDHIFLQRVAEGIRCSSQNDTFSACVQRALSDAREEIGWVEDIIAAVEVHLSYHHFIGGHSFKLKFVSLDEGTGAWEQLHAAKGQDLFRGSGVTAAYTPQAAKEQWQRLKNTFLEIAASRITREGYSRANSHEERLRTRLQDLENSYNQTRLKRECLLWNRSRVNADKALSQIGCSQDVCDALLMQRLDQLLRSQNLPQLKKIEKRSEKRRSEKKSRRSERRRKGT